MLIVTVFNSWTLFLYQLENVFWIESILLEKKTVFFIRINAKFLFKA